jgi:formyltetrahydrofolate hydrolase
MVSCADTPAILRSISGCLAEHGLTIQPNKQVDDHGSKRYFMCVG